jgi:sulfide:quinone oxidoreductase
MLLVFCSLFSQTKVADCTKSTYSQPSMQSLGVVNLRLAFQLWSSDWEGRKVGKTILILGGGTGGVVAANVLRKTLPMEHRVIVVDRNRNHYFQASYPLVLVNLRRPAQIVQRLERLEKKGIEFVQAEVQRVDFARRYVKTNQGRINYDYLIIALGAEQHLETVPGQAHRAYNPFDFYDVCRLRFLLSRLTRGHIVLYIANLPYTGVIAPFEIMFLLDAYLRQRGCRPNVRLSFVTPEPLPLSLAPPKVGQSVLRMMERRGIEVISQAKVLALDPRKKHLLLDGGLKIPGNLFLGIPSHWGPGLLRDTSLAPTGWIETDPHTLTTQVEGVYAVGDEGETDVRTTTPLPQVSIEQKHDFERRDDSCIR